MGIGNKFGNAVDDFGNTLQTKVLDPLGKAINGRNDYRVVPVDLDQSTAMQDRNLSMDARQKQDWLQLQLQNQIKGNGPSVAEQQMRYGLAEALANSQRQAASGRGVNRGMAFRESAYAGQNAQAQGTRDASLMRAQEQLGAMGQYGGLVSNMRQGDAMQRQQSLQAAMANQQAAMDAQRANAEITSGNAQRKQKGTGGLIQMGGALLGALSDVRAKSDIAPSSGSFAEQLRASIPQQAPQEQQMPSWMTSSLQAGMGAQQAGIHGQDQFESQQAQPADSGGGMAALGGAMSVFGGALSDERSKQDLRPLVPYEHTYKPQFAAMLAEQAASAVPPSDRDTVRGAVYADAREPRQSVMAQDLERSPDGKRTVRDGVLKTIDAKRGLQFALANQAGLDKRLARLERLAGE